MAPRTRRLKGCTIAISDDISPAAREKVKRWIPHNSGTISDTLNDSVTHYIVSKRDWREYKPHVQEARRMRTIYLMRLNWICDSLTPLNESRSKPLDECSEKYTFELNHAKKVVDHRKRKKAEKKRALYAAKRSAAKEEQSQTDENSNDIKMMDDTPTNTLQEKFADSDRYVHEENLSNVKEGRRSADVGRVSCREPVTDHIQKLSSRQEERRARVKFQQASECGIKFDKAVLETERSMALAGYRPYVDANGRVYFIMLVRNDVLKTVQEQYHLKSNPEPRALHVEHEPSHIVEDAIASTTRTNDSDRAPRRHACKFDAGKDTKLRYFEDLKSIINFDPPSSIDTSIEELDDGQCTPFNNLHGDLTASNPFAESLAHLKASTSYPNEKGRNLDIPFTSRPIVSYTPLSITPPSQIRVLLPRPFAYCLQMYESFVPNPDIHRPEASDTSSDSFSTTDSLPSASRSNSLTSVPAIRTRLCSADPQSNDAQVDRVLMAPANGTCTSQPLSDQVTARACPTKVYTVLCQYTRKGRFRVSEVIPLAPEGSPFIFALEMFKKFFRKKTGLDWENVGINETSRVKRVMDEENSKIDDTESAKVDSMVGATDFVDDKHLPLVIDGSHEEQKCDEAGNSDANGLKSDIVGASEEVDVDQIDKDARGIWVEPSKSTAMDNTNVTLITINTDLNERIEHPNTTTQSERNSASAILPPSVQRTTPLSNHHIQASTDFVDALRTQSTTSFKPSRSSVQDKTETTISNPFMYIPTRRKTYKVGNQRYRSTYGEDLFVMQWE